MDELLSEKEQVEQIRNWWKENGTYVILGIVLGVGGVFGFNAWKSSQNQVLVDASATFELLAEEVAENRLEPAEAIAADIYTDFGETVYADQARLAMARLYMDQGRDQDAAEALNALVESGNINDLKMVARLRLAKIYLYQGKPEEVIALLSGYEESGFAGRYSEAIGDAHFALGDYEAAEAAWQEALNRDASLQLVDAALIQMKIADLPAEGSAAPAAAPAAGEAAVTEPAAGQPSDEAAESLPDSTSEEPVE